MTSCKKRRVKFDARRRIPLRASNYLNNFVMIALLEFHDRAYRGGGGRAQNAEAMSMGCMMFIDNWTPEYIGNLIFPMGEMGARHAVCVNHASNYLQ